MVPVMFTCLVCGKFVVLLFRQLRFVTMKKSSSLLSGEKKVSKIKVSNFYCSEKSLSKMKIVLLNPLLPNVPF